METTKTVSRAKQFREAIEQRALVADGAMGTMLYSRGVFINRCFDELNLTQPDLVREVHQEYVKAGSEIIETNTFGANRLRLSGFGLADKLADINISGARLAREAALEATFVAGAIGPLGARLEPLGAVTAAEAREVFREHAAALVSGGVDLRLIETISDLQEMIEAVHAAREAAGDDMVIVAQVSIDDYGNLQDGTDTDTFTRALDASPADLIGLNCCVGPKVTLETIEKMMQISGKPTSAMPNAGHPAMV
ncbi:MAG: bifunctional homocysteine S-methyltransferase/methylenetetrahydrofolate reductase, partial [bacterium]|nr:bifunctional homocysteine S-methyltransferase/methylenetetrahydrofolate reductase [bacterium]